MVKLMQIFKKKKTKTESRDKQIQKELGITDADIEEIEDPFFAAQMNFENFKALFKRDKAISGHSNWNDDKIKIERFRETDSAGNVSKSLDAIRIKDNAHNRDYMDMINRAYGIIAEAKNGYIYITYDVKTIEKSRVEENENGI